MDFRFKEELKKQIENLLSSLKEIKIEKKKQHI